MAETLTKEQAAENGGFDMRKALNTKGFAEFLGKFPDAEKIKAGDLEVVSQRFEVFNAKETAKKEMRRIYNNEIQKEFGFRLENDELISIDEHVEKMALENPEELLQLNDKLTAFREFPVVIKKFENQLADMADQVDLEANLADLVEQRKTFDTARDAIGFTGKAKMWGTMIACALPAMGEALFSDTSYFGAKMTGAAEKLAAAEEIEKKYAKDGKKVDKERFGRISAEINNQLEIVNDTLNKIHELTDLKQKAAESFNLIRSELMGSISGMKDISEAVSRKAAGRINDMLGANTVDSFEAAQKQFDSWVHRTESGEISVDVLDGHDSAMIMDYINQGVEAKTTEAIIQAVFNSRLGNKALDSLEKTIQKYAGKEKIGSKEGEEARKLVTDALEEAEAGLPNDDEGKAKRVLIAHILFTMHNS